MAETITIICPTCEKSIKAPDSVVGKKIRCKGCGEAFTAKAPKAPKEKPGKKADAPIKVADDEDEDAVGAYGMKEEYLGAHCAECAEAMGDEDIICLHCGYNTVTRLRTRPRKVKEQTGGDVFLWLLPGILCALVALFLLTVAIIDIIIRTRMNVTDWDKLYVNLMDCFLLWFTLIKIYLIYKSARFAIRRLILNNKPPEIEEKIED